MSTFRIKTVSTLIILFLLSFPFIPVNGQNLKEIESKRVSLTNGWKLTPVGQLLPLGDLPLNIAVSPSGKMLAVTNNGQSDQGIQLIDSEKMQFTRFGGHCQRMAGTDVLKRWQISLRFRWETTTG